MATTEERLLALEAAVVGLLDRATNVEQRLDAAEGAIGVTSSLVNSLNTSTADNQTRVSSLETSFADHESRIAVLEDPPEP